MYAVPESGELVKIKEYGNAWGSAAYVWTALSEKYLGNKIAWMMAADGDGTFWKLHENYPLTLAEKGAFFFTFDFNAYALGGLRPRRFGWISPPANSGGISCVT